jgi:UPF0755 protein
MRRLTKLAALVVALIAVAVATVSFWLYRSVNEPHVHTKGDDFVQIEKGLSPKQIVARLVDEGVIESYYATIVYLRLFGDPAKLQAGEYQFDSPITPIEVLKELESGEERTVKLTIPEGFTRFDIARRIVERFPREPQIAESEILEIMNDAQKFSVIAEIAPEATNLEGYLYPSTYNFARDASPQQMIVTMVDQFGKVWKPEWTDKARLLGRSPHEIVTIASLIETESGVESERPIVASVIYNRLKKRFALGIDQTVVYVAKMNGRWDGTINQSDLNAVSPYNTRKYPGLPPGPISSVSVSALEAALSPATTDYLYYVRNVDLNDGSHWFYSSAAEFERGKAAYQRWLEREREAKRAAESGQE